MAVACMEELNIEAPAKADKGKTPVLLVHGRGSGPKIWREGSKPMTTSLTSTDDVVVVPAFDYESESTKWVANSNAAQRLAKTIVCYFLLYGKKVIGVGHSMGGLLLYEALNQPSVYGVHVNDAFGHLATIGTPFKGSWFATASFEAAIGFCKLLPVGKQVAEEVCREVNKDWSTSGLSYDSEQLEALPDLPEGITHKAIAGRIQMEVCFFECAPFSIGDGVVPSESATARYTDTGVGDGVTIFDCTVSEGAWCSHSDILQDERVQLEVVASIQTYITSTWGEIHNFYGLQLELPPEWTVDVGPEKGFLYSELQYHDKPDCFTGMRECPRVVIYDISTSKWEDLGDIIIEDGMLVAEHNCRGSMYLPPRVRAGSGNWQRNRSVLRERTVSWPFIHEKHLGNSEHGGRY
jgi:hypothetical protein